MARPTMLSLRSKETRSPHRQQLATTPRLITSNFVGCGQRAKSTTCKPAVTCIFIEAGGRSEEQEGGAVGGNYSSQIGVDSSEEPKKVDPVWVGFSVIGQLAMGSPAVKQRRPREQPTRRSETPLPSSKCSKFNSLPFLKVLVGILLLDYIWHWHFSTPAGILLASLPSFLPEACS